MSTERNKEKEEKPRRWKSFHGNTIKKKKKLLDIGLRFGDDD